MEDDCDCCDDEALEEVAHGANNKIDALINILVKKNIISEKDLQKEFEAMFEEAEEVTDSEENIDEED